MSTNGKGYNFRVLTAIARGMNARMFGGYNDARAVVDELRAQKYHIVSQPEVNLRPNCSHHPYLDAHDELEMRMEINNQLIEVKHPVRPDIEYRKLEWLIDDMATQMVRSLIQRLSDEA